MFYNTFVEMFEFRIYLHHLITYFGISFLMVLNNEDIEMLDDILFDWVWIMIDSKNHKNRREVFFDNDIQPLVLYDVFSIYFDEVFLLSNVVYVVIVVVFEFDRAGHDNHGILLELNKLWRLILGFL
jgi:hypothetical protein